MSKARYQVGAPAELLGQIHKLLVEQLLRLVRSRKARPVDMGLAWKLVEGERDKIVIDDAMRSKLIELHGHLVDVLLERVKSGEATAAEMSVARELLAGAEESVWSVAKLTPEEAAGLYELPFRRG